MVPEVPGLQLPSHPFLRDDSRLLPSTRPQSSNLQNVLISISRSVSDLSIGTPGLPCAFFGALS